MLSFFRVYLKGIISLIDLIFYINDDVQLYVATRRP